MPDHLTRQQRYRARKIKRGLCPKCSNALEPGKTMCAFHLAYSREYMRARKANADGSATTGSQAA